MFSIKTNRPRNTFFIFMIIHLFTLDAKASGVPKLDLDPEAEDLTTIKTSSSNPDTVPLYFSHLQSRIMRNMGYCLLSIVNTKTGMRNDLPLFNVFTRSSIGSPRKKIASGTLADGHLSSPRTQRASKATTSPREEEKKTRYFLPSPRTQPYEKEHSLPRELLNSDHCLYISFFQEGVSFSKTHSGCYSYLPWQGLENIFLLDFKGVLKKKKSGGLISLSLDIDWNKKSPADSPIELTGHYDPRKAAIHDLRYATRIIPRYKTGDKKNPRLSKKTGIKKSQTVKGV